MVREQASEFLPIIKAFAEGKAVEYLNNEKRWVEGYDLSFWLRPQDYRIKPDNTEQKYRPFKIKEECWNEMLKHQPFGWLINRDDQYINPLSIGDGKDFVNWFNLYTFADGAPFGIKE